MNGTIMVAGSLAQRPYIGGHTWVFMQYVIGFRRLGWDVIFLDRLEPEMCFDEAGESCPLDQSRNIRYFREVMDRFELENSFCLLYDHGRETVGLSREQIVERARDAAFLLNIMGFVTDEDILGAVKRRVFLDIDPGFGQMWKDLGLFDLFAHHDDVVTVGENVGQESCTIPTCGLSWITTPPPVVLDLWPSTFSSSLRCFTTVASWRGAFGPIEYRGQIYGLRVHEFRKFVDLPARTGQSFELALDIQAEEIGDLALLRSHNWSFADPRKVAGDPWSYQAYIQQSGAEFMVAKNMYVATKSGWLSDRSICYLASGKPVVAQDTGIQDRYPTGEGLLTFSTIDDAAGVVDALQHDYTRHARVARNIAEEYFDSDKVLTRLLDALAVA